MSPSPRAADLSRRPTCLSVDMTCLPREPRTPGSASCRRLQRFPVELLGVAAHEEIADDEHGDPQETVHVQEITLGVGGGQRRLAGIQAHDLLPRLGQEPPGPTGQREGRRAIDRRLLDEAALILDAPLGEKLSRLGTGGSAVLVVEDRPRHGVVARARGSAAAPAYGAWDGSNNRPATGPDGWNRRASLTLATIRYATMMMTTTTAPAMSTAVNGSTASADAGCTAITATATRTVRMTRLRIRGVTPS